LVVEWIAFGVSITALAITLWAWKKPRPIRQKDKEKPSLFALFEMLSSPKIKDYKKNIAFWYWNRVDRSAPVYFINSKYENDSYYLKQAFNQAAAIYEQGLVDQEYFRHVFGGTLVRFWHILKEDIIQSQKENPEICKHFQSVAKELIDKYKIDGKPYRTRP